MVRALASHQCGRRFQVPASSPYISMRRMGWRIGRELVRRGKRRGIGERDSFRDSFRFSPRSPPRSPPLLRLPHRLPYMGCICCWFSLLLPEVLFGYIFQILIRVGKVDKEPPCGCATSKGYIQCSAGRFGLRISKSKQSSPQVY